MKRMFLWAVGLVCLLTVMPVAAGSIESRLSEKDPVTLADIWVEGSIHPVTGAYTESHADLHCAGTHPLVATRRYNGELKPEEIAIDLGSGWTLSFGLQSDTLMTEVVGDAVEVRKLSPDASRVVSWIRYKRTAHDLFLESCDGSSCRYQFNDHGLLCRVTLSTGVETQYRYDSCHRLVHREDAEGRFLTLDRDPETGRITKQVSTSQAPIHYRYGQSEVEVIATEGQSTVYHIDARHVIAIETRLDGCLYRQERWIWGRDDKLVGYAIVDSQGLALGYRAFEYDCQGRCISTKLYGNLTGQGSDTFPLTPAGLLQTECVATTFCFSDNGPSKLLSISEQNGLRVTFVYDTNTGAPTAKYLWEQDTLRQRLFLRYDASGTLVETTLDDGCAIDPADLSGVTERRITSLTTRQQSPGFGLPLIIDEKIWDFETGTAKIVRTAVRSYNAEGRLIKEQRFDATSDHCGTTDYEYDAHGQLITGDDAVNLIYDLAGRVIRKEMHDAEGKLYTTRFRYNAVGQRVETIDLFDNATHYTYDALGRCLCTRYPSISSAAGCTLQPETSQSYDVLNRPTIVKDANGYCTRFRYNLRGQPVEITHPDNTHETFRYALDGSQVSHTNRQGRVTQEQRDVFGRVTAKTVNCCDGTSVNLQAFYNSFHLTGTLNAEGEQTLFSYDSAGRLTEATSVSGACERQTIYHYDVHGRLEEARQCFGCGDHDVSCLLINRANNADVKATVTDGAHNTLVASEYLKPPKTQSDVHYDMSFVNTLGQKVLRTISTDALGKRTVMTYDALGHVVEIEEQSPLGQRLSHRQLFYDAAGHCVVEQNNAVDGCNAWLVSKRFGPMNRLEELSEGVGTAFEAHTTYCYNDIGLLEQLTTPKGVSLHYSYDGFGRLVHLHSSDKTVAYRYQYDNRDRPTLIVDLVHGTSSHRHYGSRGELLDEQMDHGLAVHYVRDPRGRTTQLTLPDESSIRYHYEAVLLRSIDRADSSGHVLYSHQYDRYSPSGRIESEQLIGKLGNVTYTYDTSGRRQTIHSPFWSETIGSDAVDAAGNITKLEVTDAKGPYRMRFSYDCQGQLVGEAGVGIHPYTYDSAHNRTSQGISQHVINHANQVMSTDHAQYSYDANGNRTTKQSDNTVTHYSYDALDRLTVVEIPLKQRVSFRYDAIHRRISKQSHVWDTETASWTPQPTVRYLYDGNREIGTVDEQGQICQLRVLGIGIANDVGAAIAMEIDGALYAPIHDHRGSVACLVNAMTGQVAEISRLSAYGEEQLFAGTSLEPITSANAINPWRFSGKRYDAETDLVLFGRRYYDPALGRWLTRDPLGKLDGVNDYAFVHNNPVNRIDPNGLFSLQTLWTGLSDAALDYVSGLSSGTGELVDLLKRDLFFITDISDQALYTGNQIIGPKIWNALGFYYAEHQSGIVGDHEISSYLRFSHINGIQNTHEEALRAVTMISELHGGANIHYTYRPTAGWTWDFVNALLLKVGLTSPTARCLAEKWKGLIDEMGGLEGGGTIIHYAHSLGGAETNCARTLMTPEELAMIRVFTFGSPVLAKAEGFQSVTNYVSRLDPVSLADPIRYLAGFFDANSNVIFVGTFWGIPLLDHSLDADPYRLVLDDLGKNWRSD